MRWNIKPSKPAAVFGALFGVAVLVAGLVSMDHFTAFTILWVVAGVAIILFNLWAAFSRRGSLYSAELSGESADRHTARNDPRS